MNGGGVFNFFPLIPVDTELFAEMISSWAQTKNRIYVLWYRNTYKSQWFTCVDFSYQLYKCQDCQIPEQYQWGLSYHWYCSHAPCTSLSPILDPVLDPAFLIPWSDASEMQAGSLRHLPGIKLWDHGLDCFHKKNIVWVRSGAFQNCPVLNLILQRVEYLSLI